MPPGIQEFDDGVPLTLGVRFASDSAGQVTGIRYYKSAGNPGTHTGALYTAGGQQLASVTFTVRILRRVADRLPSASPWTSQRHRVRGRLPLADRCLFGDTGRS